MLVRRLCDDETPERLSKLVAEQNGRMLQASAEGTLFEIVLGRYADRSNFDVYLKAHSGEYLSVGRITREADRIEKPALSIAVAVQPGVIQGLAENASLGTRGFLVGQRHFSKWERYDSWQRSVLSVEHRRCASSKAQGRAQRRPG